MPLVNLFPCPAVLTVAFLHSSHNGENLSVRILPWSNFVIAINGSYSTGASGYIGGDVLYALKSALPTCQYTVLLRDEAKAQKLSQAYPDVQIVLGDLDASSTLEQQAREADIVIREYPTSRHPLPLTNIGLFSLDTASSNHVKSAEAIARGLTAAERPKPGNYLLPPRPSSVYRCS